MLERLGEPEEIVAVAATPTVMTGSDDRPRSGRLEIAALIALVIPVFGWLVGVVLVVSSRVWSAREKLVGVALGLLPLLLPLAVFTSGASGGEAVPVGTGIPTDEANPIESDDGSASLSSSCSCWASSADCRALST